MASLLQLAQMLQRMQETNREQQHQVMQQAFGLQNITPLFGQKQTQPKVTTVGLPFGLYSAQK